MSTLLNQIKSNKANVFRRLYVKRRIGSTGLFETDWTEITSDVMKWGKISKSIDDKQYNKFKFTGTQISVSNKEGRFNPETNPSSLWYGFLSPQRSLVRIEAGFFTETLGADGIWTRTEYPQETIDTTTMSYPLDLSSPSAISVNTGWRIARPFTTPSKNAILNTVRVPIYKGAVTIGGSALVEIYKGASISGKQPLFSQTYSMADLTFSSADLTTSSFIPFTFDKKLDPNSTYWMVVSGNATQPTSTGGFLSYAYDSVGASEPVYWSVNSGTSYALLGYGFGYVMSLTVQTTAALFTGVIIGDLPTSDDNVVTIQAQPLLDLFRQYPARLLDYTSTGVTASQFVEAIRDHTDGSSNFVFLPFFGNTTTGFEIQTSTVLYANLNTQTAKDVIDSNVWSVLETLAQAETYVPYITNNGVFKFVARSVASATAFEFHGVNSIDREYGITIKNVSAFGLAYSKYYSRVNVRWDEADTATSVQTVAATFQVTGDNLPWIYGHRTLDQSNFFIQSASIASQIAQTVFDDVSAVKQEITFNSTFVPQLEIFDRIQITYDNANFTQTNLWDLNNWSDTATTNLIWDPEEGDALKLNDAEFSLLKITQDLDNFTTQVTAREAT